MAKRENLANPIENLETIWDNHTGQEVETFITEELEKAENGLIIGMTYENLQLVLHKANGDTVEAEVSVITPTYYYGIKLYGVMVDDDTNKIYTAADSNLVIQYTPNRNVKVGIIMYAISQTTTITNLIGPFDVRLRYGDKFNIFKVNNVKYEDCVINNGELTGYAGDISEIAWVDITSLFTASQSSANIMATVMADTTATSTLALGITTQKIDLVYNNSVILNSNGAQFTLNGGSATNYHLEGFDNGSRIQNTPNGSLTYSGLVTGLNQLVVRAVHNNYSDIFTEWYYVDLIYTEDLEQTTVAINKVSAKIPNNGIAQLYELTVYSPNQDSVSLTTYLEDIEPLELQPLNNVKYEVITASSYDSDNKYVTSYQKYMEIVSESPERYLMVKVNNNFYKFFNIFTSPRTGEITASTYYYKTMVIDLIDQKLIYYQEVTPSLNFDQSTGRSNNVIITSDYANNGLTPNVSSTLEISDGWKEENGRTLFRMSAQANPILTPALNLNLGTQFTIEMGFKTYNISDLSKPILTIGQFQLRPDQFCWNTDDPTLFSARNAQFQTNKETHIMMTVEGNHSISKGQPYYPNYLGSDFQSEFDNNVQGVTFNLVRIYVNGTIDREIIISAGELSNLRQAVLQIAPTASDMDLFLFRVYNNTALSMDAALQNYISFLKTKEEKQKVYDANDLLGDNGEISFDKCYPKYNTIVYVLPEGCRFPNRAWGKPDGNAKKDFAKFPTTVFLNYVNPEVNKIYGGKWVDMTLTAQGSSAMRYLIWNCQTAAGKFKDKRVDDEGNYLNKAGEIVASSDEAQELKRKSAFISFSDANYDEETRKFKPEATTTTSNYYIMPPYDGMVSDDRAQIKKAVGKVNFASSMQSHKEGAIKLYNDAYLNINGALLTGGRKGSREEPFLYFYWESNKTSSKSEKITSAQNKDKNYWKTRGEDEIQQVELSELFNNPDVHFMGFQTWGSAKADNATYGYDEELTPEYLLVEGGENSDPAVNFRVPWMCLQRAQGEGATKTLGTAPTLTPAESLEAPWANLLVADESIVYMDRGALDIDYGVAELTDAAGLTYFEIAEEAYPTLKFFREFYDFVYKHDYNFKVTLENQPGENWDVKYKYAVNKQGAFDNGSKVYSVSKGDLFRYDDPTGLWVPAGLTYENGEWQPLNIYKVAGDLPSTEGPDIARSEIKAIFTDDIQHYIDLRDVAFHQAVIKFLSGTDNRAKNTYFQVIGKIYEYVDVENPDFDPEQPESDANPRTKTIKRENTSKDGYRIRFMQDDMDTILLTDNSGLQSKPYNLLEASYRAADAEHWGDSNNIFFYMFDQCFELTIKEQLRQIINFAFGQDNNMDTSGNYFYKAFFSVQDMFPPVTYNHTSKIYYENAEFVRRSNALGSIYTNNNIEPIEQAHGSSIASEKEFMKKRLNFLGTYVGSAMGNADLVTAPSGAGGQKLRLTMTFEPYQDFYPRYQWELGNPVYLGILNNDTESKDFDIRKYLAIAGREYTVQVAPQGTAINQGIYSVGLYKKLDITGLHYSNLNANFEHMTDFTVDNDNLYDINGNSKSIKPFYGELQDGVDYPEFNIAAFTASFPVLEHLTLRNMSLPTGLDLSEFSKLQSVDLTNSTVHDVTFPESGRLKTIVLPDTITTFKLYNNTGIESVTFQGISNLETVYLNCAAVGQFNVNAFVESLVDCPNLQSITLTNANLYITEEALVKLCSVHTCRVSGTINVVSTAGTTVNFKSITLNTKRLLVETFGDFTATTSNVIINYNIVDVTGANVTAASEVSIYSDTYPVTKPNIFNVQVSTGNNVSITTDGNGKPMLDIKYSMSGVATSIAEINQYTGVITLKGSTNTPASVRITIKTDKNETIQKTCIVNFTWSAPNIGDFAYIDGTFSAGYDPTKTVIGIVYARNEETETSGTVYIIGKEFANQEHYGGFTSEGNVSDPNSVIKDLGYVRDSILGASLPNYNVVDVATVSQTVDNINVNNRPTGSYNSFAGKSDTAAYVNKVSEFLGKHTDDVQLSRYFRAVSVIVDGNTQTRYQIESMNNLNSLAEALTKLNVPGMSSSDSDVVSCLLYPYYYSAYLYEPMAEHGEDIDDQYKKNNWYVPSYFESARIAYLRGYSVTGSNFLNANDVRTPVVSSVANGGDEWTTPIFSLAKAKMGNAYPNCWDSLFGTQNNNGGKNNVTTSVASAQNSYSYQAVNTSMINNQYESQWVAGRYNSNSYYNYDSSQSNAWRLTKHQGVPFTQYNYSKA